MRARDLLSLTLSLAWVLAFAHCVSECAHAHTPVDAELPFHHHHHGGSSSDPSNEPNHEASPCELKSFAPLEVGPRLLAQTVLLASLQCWNGILPSFAAGNSATARFSREPPECHRTGALEFLLRTLHTPNAPPFIS